MGDNGRQAQPMDGACQLEGEAQPVANAFDQAGQGDGCRILIRPKGLQDNARLWHRPSFGFLGSMNIVHFVTHGPHECLTLRHESHI